MTNYVLGKLLQEYFTTKKEMADALGIQYRMLLRVLSTECSNRDIEIVINSVIRYCAAHDIPIEHTFDDMYE